MGELLNGGPFCYYCGKSKAIKATGFFNSNDGSPILEYKCENRNCESWCLDNKTHLSTTNVFLSLFTGRCKTCGNRFN